MLISLYLKRSFWNSVYTVRAISHGDCNLKAKLKLQQTENK